MEGRVARGIRHTRVQLANTSLPLDTLCAPRGPPNAYAMPLNVIVNEDRPGPREFTQQPSQNSVSTSLQTIEPAYLAASYRSPSIHALYNEYLRALQSASCGFPLFKQARSSHRYRSISDLLPCCTMRSSTSCWSKCRSSGRRAQSSNITAVRTSSQFPLNLAVTMSSDPDIFGP